MCDHLLKLDLELKNSRIKETSRGEAWTKNTREWVYYDCVESRKIAETFCISRLRNHSH
jgi:hypothetical protein